MPLSPSARVKLASKARLRWDEREKKHVLLSPERGLVLSETASATLALCDGARTLDEIVDVLAEKYGAKDASDRARIATDVTALLERIHARALLEIVP